MIALNYIYIDITGGAHCSVLTTFLIGCVAENSERLGIAHSNEVLNDISRLVQILFTLQVGVAEFDTTRVVVYFQNLYLDFDVFTSIFGLGLFSR